MVARLVIFLALAGWLAAAPPDRIVSTAPSITEMLYAVGAGDRVAGVTTYCVYPPEARSKPKIGTYIEPSLEKIASLRPDLVIIQKNPIQLGARIQALGLKVIEVSHDTVEEVYLSIERIGDAVGNGPQARQVVARLRSELDAVRKAASGRRRTRIMLIVGRAPAGIEDLIAVGRASYLNGLIEIAGGDNIFKEAAASYPKVGLEEILARNPEVVVDMGDMSDAGRITESQRNQVLKLWSAYPAIAAVHSGRVYAVAPDVFTVPGPRMAEAARAFAEMLRR